MTTEPTMALASDLHTLISEQELQARIRELADQINEAYKDTDRLVVVAILKGAFMFTADLIKHLKVPCQVEFIRLSSYGNAKTTSGVVKPVDLSLPELAGKDVLVVEDIVDTGLTLSFLLEYLHSIHQIRSLRLAVLLDKPAARKQEVPVDFLGFTVEDKFLVGYGLDCAGLYRNLPYIAYIAS